MEAIWWFFHLRGISLLNESIYVFMNLNVDIIACGKCISRLQNISKCFTLQFYSTTLTKIIALRLFYTSIHKPGPKIQKLNYGNPFFFCRTSHLFYIKYGSCKSLYITNTKIRDIFIKLKIYICFSTPWFRKIVSDSK